MLYLKLCKPIIIDSQIPEISKLSGIPEEDLYSVLEISKLYFRHFNDTFADRAMTYAEAEEVGYTEKEAEYGSSAILRKCQEVGPEITPIREINIPVDVYQRICPAAWDDICYLFSRVENRNNRLQRLIELGAPEIILRNEERLLTEYIEQLEHNNLYAYKNSEGYHYKRTDGRILRSLNDMGYSILHGWDPEIQEEMEKEFNKFLRLAEEQPSESED